MPTISFYRVNDPYGFFSNFSPHPVWIGGYRWPTTEHYFQSRKFMDGTVREVIRTADSPMKAATLGRDRRFSLRSDWDERRDDFMRVALQAKFLQHEDLRAELIGTGNAVLVESTSNDSYWADGGDGSGANRLGLLLMELREWIRSFGVDYVFPPWIVYPDISPEDLFWRMGQGEVYIDKWTAFFSGMNKLTFRHHFPLPEGWEEPDE